jgi:hypothetical protein
MKRLYICGDLHFSTNKEWNTEAFNKFIDWFENYEWDSDLRVDNYADRNIIFLGDIVEKAANLGDTLEMVTKFFNICCRKFSKIYILGGNHCHKLVNDRSQYASQFLPYLGANNIENIFDEKIFLTKNLFKIIALPYKRINGKILDDYYSNELPKEFYETEADLICGHVALKEARTFYGGIDISKFKTKTKAFGHIHTRNGNYKQYYTGSIMPFKIDEEQTEIPRCIKCLEKDNGIIKETEIPIPIFVNYESIYFENEPKYKKNSDDKVHIYTIVGCKNVNQAKNFYPNYYIRGVEKISSDSSTTADEQTTTFMTPLIALETMLKETKMNMKRKTMMLLKTLLG